jgi:hypothetical protein
MEEMTTQPTAEQLTHDEAIDAICGCAATVTVLSYQEAIESYLDLRGIDPDAIQATEARMSSAERERCARIVEDWPDNGISKQALWRVAAVIRSQNNA